MLTAFVFYTPDFNIFCKKYQVICRFCGCATDNSHKIGKKQPQVGSATAVFGVSSNTKSGDKNAAAIKSKTKNKTKT